MFEGIFVEVADIITLLCLFFSSSFYTIDFFEEKKYFTLLLFWCFLHCVSNIVSDIGIYIHNAPIEWVSIIVFYFTGYLSCHATVYFFASVCVEDKSIVKKIKRYADIYTGFTILVIACLIPTKLVFYVAPNGEYFRGDWFFLSHLFVVAGLVVNTFFVHKYTKEKSLKFAFEAYMILPGIASICTVFLESKINLMDISTSCIMIILFTTVTYNFQKRAKKREEEFASFRINTMMSQIQPHFLYNTLNSISGLCIVDPPKAMDLTAKFADYLRENIDSLSLEELVPLEKEIEHTRIYTDIEKIRFGDRVNVIYNIDNSSFKLPFLTIQPLVENAIKHGICKKKDGGTVEITTYEDKRDYIIKIVDDGVGFDTEKEINDGKIHYGMSLVKKRVEIMCGGVMKVDSVLGEGTRTVILIPKEK